MAECAAAFDPALIDMLDITRVVEDAAAIEKMAAAMKAQAAAKLADTELWRRDGDRSPAHHLARMTGTSVGSAGDTLETARRLAELPAVAEAARRGELSAQQTSAIADAAAMDPAAEQRLLREAR